MFQASSCPSSGVTTTAVAASGLPLEFGDSSAVGRGCGRAGYKQPTSVTYDLTLHIKHFIGQLFYMNL
jgi:hypothetical protein